jgi:ParB family chromosome partitioning protein
MSQMSTCEPNDAASESAPPQSTVLHIALRHIKVGFRRRQINPERIADLAESMRDQGQLQPIIVVPSIDHEGCYELIAGNRRREAALQLGWKAIRPEVLDGLDADARALVEIDENLRRDDLSKSERAAHIADRKEIYERLHPETRVGATGRKGRKICDNKTTDRFTKDTAAKTGRSERSVQLDAKRGKQQCIKETIGTSLDKGDELDALAEITEVDPVKANALVDQAKAEKK